jgi:hypothetical protein
MQRKKSSIVKSVRYAQQHAGMALLLDHDRFLASPDFPGSLVYVIQTQHVFRVEFVLKQFVLCQGQEKGRRQSFSLSSPNEPTEQPLTIVQV